MRLETSAEISWREGAVTCGYFERNTSVVAHGARPQRMGRHFVARIDELTTDSWTGYEGAGSLRQLVDMRAAFERLLARAETVKLKTTSAKLRAALGLAAATAVVTADQIANVDDDD